MKQQPVVIDGSRLYTVAEIETFPEDELWEIIDGIPFKMTAPTEDHQFISVKLTRILDEFLDEKPCQVFHAPYAVFIPKKGESIDESKTLVLPDLVVICDEKKRSQRGCRGGPDLVIEILSPSTSSRDQILKRNLYESNGVKEYWVIDPVYRMLTINVRGQSGRFDQFLPFDPSMEVRSVLFPDLSFKLERIFPKPPARTVRQPAAPYGATPRKRTHAARNKAKQAGSAKQTKQIASSASPSRNDGDAKTVVGQPAAPYGATSRKRRPAARKPRAARPAKKG